MTPEQEKIYEDGFIAGMQKQMQSSVDKAVNAMAQRPLVGLTDADWKEIEDMPDVFDQGVAWCLARLKKKNAPQTTGKNSTYQREGEHMTDVYKTMEAEKLKLEEIAREARVELTPELRVFAWLIKHHALIDFWDSAAKQAKYQHEMLERFLEKEKNT